MDKSNYPNGRLLKLAINERQKFGMIPVNVTNSNGQAVEVMKFQQIFSPSTPTVETLAVKSDFDTFGGTVIEEQNLKAFEDGTIYNNSISQLDFATSDTGTVVESFENVQSVPAGTVDNTVRYQAKGLSLANSVKESDFETINEWIANKSVLTKANNILSITGDGTGNAPQAYQSTPIPYLISTNTCFKVKARVTNSDCTKILIRVYDNSGNYPRDIVVVSNPEVNKWYDLFTIYNSLLADSSTIRIYLRHEYADSATANGKVMEVDGNAGVFAINLTQLGISDILTSAGYTTDEQQEEAMLNIVRNLDAGTTDIQSAVVDYVSVGKNLLNIKEFIENGSAYYSINSSGEITITAVDGRDGVSDLYFIKLKQNTSYTIKSTNAIKHRVYEKGNVYALSTTNGANELTFTTTDSEYYGFKFVNVSNPYILGTVQLELGSTATAYQPYRDSTLQLSTPLRSLPNGVRDEIRNAYEQ